ncbi:efflux RND transporter permease subunit [Oceanicella actignis]|uniref:Multidrug efflux pump subunit AcrB n=1 Tax=Oceanicella actignis TaxID=1189325 RepID=A0A1M7T3T8_9RHOB|nr:efflux RND transporter permease subunit [Oceanicella actignis]SET40811.1 Multidrug efflux pump subunit AcrB [Oceanicella actignis]SHN65420.1 Multidrug efflux pump subunit AcrB [Oceanicella actignis]
MQTRGAGAWRGGLLAHFARHPTAANLLLALMVLLGAWGAGALRAQFLPDVVIETVIVSVAWEGAAPQEMDDAVVARIEPAVAAVEGVARTRSDAREGGAWITAEFEPGWNMDRAVQEVQAAVDAVTGLPDAADPPEVRRGVWRDRVTDVVVHGPLPPEQLTRIADEFAARLAERGISRVEVLGAPAPTIRVSVEEASMIRHDLTLETIARTVGAAVSASPAGEMESRAARLRAGLERRTPEALAELELPVSGLGEALRLRDVARIERLGVEEGVELRVGANPAVALRVDRSAAGDAIQIQRQTAELAARMNKGLPEGVRIELVRSRAERIEQRLAMLLDNAATGLALVVALLFVFLSARTAFWVAAGIPASMLAAVGLMHAFGLTLNMVSLFALIITLGIVVDDAIVVGEHADHLARARGTPPARAALAAARRMTAPVFAASATTIVAFGGLTLVGGRFGELIADIPFTVAAVLAASLAECFLVLPAHMTHALAAKTRAPWYDAPSRAFNRAFRAFRERAFRPVLAVAMRLRYPLTAAAVLLLALSVEQILRGTVPWRFWAPPERGALTVNVVMLPGASRADTRAAVDEAARAVAAAAARMKAEHGVDPVAFVETRVGALAGRGVPGAETRDPDELGAVSVELIDADLRPFSSFDFLDAVRRESRPHPMAETVSFRSMRSGPEAGIEVQLHGADPRALKAAAEALKARMAALDGVGAIEDDMPYDKTELVIEPTPLGRALGFTAQSLGRELFARLEGIEAARFAEGKRTARIVVRQAEAETAADFLTRARVRAPSGAWAPLSAVAELREGQGFARLRRENGLLRVSVTADLDDQDAARAAALRAELSERIVPEVADAHGVAYRLAGLDEDEQAFLSDALKGFLACIAGIWLILAWVFGSWTRPLAVLVVIPLGLVGAVWGHWLHDTPLSMFSVVGLMGMAGIIINDSIVLIAAIDEHARRRALFPAVIDAVCERLRPVLLTTLTTVLGLAPLLFERSQQAQFLKPAVISLCYGLGFGLLLVLVVTPALALMQQDVGAALRAMRRMARRPARLRAAARRG